MKLPAIFKGRKKAVRKRGKQLRVVKVLPVKHLYRGVARNVVVELDLVKSTLAVRLSGCRSRKTYQVEDLFNWGAQTTFL